MFEHGLVIGKFYPFHNGHRHLMAVATEQCRKVSVILCEREGETIPGATRAAWISECFPGLHELIIVQDDYDPDDSKLWADLTIEWLGRAPDAVFTSEAYGEPYAKFLGCAHVSVDPDRKAHPCNGRSIRRDPWGHWECLPPPVRAWYARRIVIVGAESTGTTTLAQDLAKHYETVYAEEYGRTLTEIKMRIAEEWTSEDFAAIARKQCEIEDDLARQANRLLICDTNAFATILWHRRYMESEHAEVKRIADARRCDLYILTGDEIPFVQDGLRDGEHIRHDMHRWFEEALAAQPVPWITVRGTPEERVQQAVAAIEPLLRAGKEEVAAMGGFMMENNRCNHLGGA